MWRVPKHGCNWRRPSLIAARPLIASPSGVTGRSGRAWAGVGAGQADVQAAQARRQQAALNLEFTQIKAPVAGRIGAAMVKPGNLVAPGETLLSTLVSVDPVHVVFEADERTFLRYRASAAGAQR